MLTALARNLAAFPHTLPLRNVFALLTSCCVFSCVHFESTFDDWSRREAGFGTESSNAPNKPYPFNSVGANRVATGPEDEANGGSAQDASGPNLWARWNALRGDAYVLDQIDRFVDPMSKRPTCDPSAMVAYRGETLRYQGGAVTVSAPFRERLARFERVVSEVAMETYGRVPSKIVHFGAYACRVSRNRNHRLSEHALGNAIDVVGFDFGALRKDQVSNPDLPRVLRGPFQVRVAKHWHDVGKSPADVHSRFLHRLTERLRERGDVFCGMIGPSRRDHSNHLHLDVSPWHYDWL